MCVRWSVVRAGWALQGKLSQVLTWLKQVVFICCRVCPVRRWQWNTLGSVSGHGVAAALLWRCTAAKTAQMCSLAPPQHHRGIFLEMHFKVLILVGVTETQFENKTNYLETPLE